MKLTNYPLRCQVLPRLTTTWKKTTMRKELVQRQAVEGEVANKADAHNRAAEGGPSRLDDKAKARRPVVRAPREGPKSEAERDHSQRSELQPRNLTVATLNS